MKFASALLASSLLLAGEPHLRAAGPDDSYLEAYRLIQEADQLVGTSQPDLARQRYERALEELKQIQTSYPNYSKHAVEFRVEYVQDKLKTIPAAEKAAVPQVQRAPAGSSRADLTNRIAQLEADNALLQAKLQEAMAPRPAAADPAEFNKAQERAKQLEKEKELLQADLNRAQAKQPNAGDALMLEQAKAELDQTRKKLLDNISNIAALTRENQELKQQLAATPKAAPAATVPAPAAAPDNSGELRARLAALEAEQGNWKRERADLEAKLAAAAKPQSENAKVKDLEKEREALQKKLNEANKELYDSKSRGQAAQSQTVSNQIANLRARLEVFEARKVPYSKEELALMDPSPSPRLAAAVAPKKAPRELPPGAAVLVTEAERAFAARRYEEAEQKYAQVLRMDENNPVSLANLAAIQLERQKMDEAEANLKKALSIAPDDAYALTLTGMLRFQQGKYDEALDVLSRAAQIDPKNAETQNYLGITLSQQGQREAAETALRKAVQLSPNYAIAHHNLAVVYATQRPPFLELAKYHYQKALALGHPGTPDLEKQLGR